MDDLGSKLATMIEIDAGEHDITIADNATVEARLLVKGRRNRLLVASGVMITPFASLGFAPTVPSPHGGPYAITIEGEDNVIQLGASTRLGVNLVVRGDRNTVDVGEACHLHGFINVLCSDGRLAIGQGTTMVQGSIQLHEPGEILVGRDCMISSQVYISLSDIHPIFDRASGQRINPAASVILGDHVWAGLRCMIMKGARIGEGGIIAAGAIVSGITPPNAVIAGVPGRVVRENVEWRRDFSQAGPEPTGLVAPGPAKRAWPFWPLRRA